MMMYIRTWRDILVGPEPLVLHRQVQAYYSTATSAYCHGLVYDFATPINRPSDRATCVHLRLAEASELSIVP